MVNMLEMILYFYLIPVFICLIFIRKFKYKILETIEFTEKNKDIDYNRFIFFIAYIPIYNLYLSIKVLLDTIKWLLN